MYNLSSLGIKYFKDIRFWIVLFFIIRLYGITLPPLEVAHNWRQTDGLMIARNFYEGQANIFYPKIDVAGEKTGIVGSELPLLNYLIYLISLLFGYEHWYGRIIVLIFSSIGVYFFSKLVKLFFGEQTSFNSSILLIVSLWFSYSRKIIPDTFAISLCIISLYFASIYFQSGKGWHLLLFFILGVFGCLSKILSCTVLTLLILPIFDNAYPSSRKIFIFLCSILILVLVCIWYFVWVPYLNYTYEFQEHFFMGTTYLQGLLEIKQNLYKILMRLFTTPLKYTGFAIFLYSIYITVKNKHFKVLYVFLIPYISFIIILIKTGSAVIDDRYYILTIIPPISLITGYGISLINNKRVAAAILVIVTIEGIADQIYDFRIRQPYESLVQLESIMDSVSEREDLIATNGPTHNPTVLYFAHRRGWNASADHFKDIDFLRQIKTKGCRYIVITKKLHGDISLTLPILYDSEYFKIYQL